MKTKRARGLGRRFQPGQTGNPGGRPKFSKLSHALRDRLASVVPGTNQTHAEAFAEILCNAGLRGDKHAIEFISARCEGYPSAALEVKDTTVGMPADEHLTETIVALLQKGHMLALEAAKKRGDLRRVALMEKIDALQDELAVLDAEEQQLLPAASAEIIDVPIADAPDGDEKHDA